MGNKTVSRRSRGTSAILACALAVSAMFMGAQTAHAVVSNATVYVSSTDRVNLEYALGSAAPFFGGTATFKNLDPAGTFVATMPAAEVDWARQNYLVSDTNPNGLAQCIAGAEPSYGGPRLASFNQGVYNPATDNYSAQQLAKFMGADAFWSAGNTGRNVDVALVDTGVAPVGDLANPNVVIHGPDFSFESQNDAYSHTDEYGHGTHMAGIIHAVAPSARIVDVKVGSAGGAVDVTQVMAAIDWVREHANSNGLHIKVINLSWGLYSATSNWKYDDLAHVMEAAWQAGIVVVVPAGNTGSQSDAASLGGLLNPAFDPNLLAVGSFDTGAGAPGVWTNAHPSDFSTLSNRQDTRAPDIAAPGSHVASYRVPGSVADAAVADELCDNVVTDPDTGLPVLNANGTTTPITYPIATDANGVSYVRGSGTSQAVAFASGAVALMADRWSYYFGGGATNVADSFKIYMKGKAHAIPGGGKGVTGQGAIDLRAMLQSFPNPYATQNHDSAQMGIDLEATRFGQHLLDPTPGAVAKIGATSPYMCAQFGSYIISQPVTMADGSGVRLCSNETIFGTRYDYVAHLTAVDAGHTYTSTPFGETWAGDTNQWDIWVAPPSTNVNAVNGFDKVPALGNGQPGSYGLAWPKPMWNPTDWANTPWTTLTQSSIVWNGKSGWTDGTVNGDGWDSHGWRSHGWRDADWDSHGWRSHGWRLGSWSNGNWREFGYQ